MLATGPRAPETDLARLAQVIRTHSILRGEFRLASGATSDYYLDCRKTTLDPEGANLVGRCILALLDREGLQPDAVGGPTLGADPIATAVSVLSWQAGRPIPAFLVRKTIKEHGTAQEIEGWLPPGGRVLVVEDVVTSGASILQAVEAVTRAGARVAAVVAIVDREEGGAQRLEMLRFLRLFRIKDLL